MEQIRSYLLSIVTAAIFTVVIKAIAPAKGIHRQLIQTLCSILVLMVALQPITQNFIGNISNILPNISEAGEDAASYGESYARETWAAGIKQRTEAYILDKAANYDVQLEVEVTIQWTDTPIPAGVIISGVYSPYAKKQLTSIIEKDLGIPPEDQQWNG